MRSKGNKKKTPLKPQGRAPPSHGKPPPAPNPPSPPARASDDESENGTRDDGGFKMGDPYDDTKKSDNESDDDYNEDPPPPSDRAALAAYARSREQTLNDSGQKKSTSSISETESGTAAPVTDTIPRTRPKSKQNSSAGDQPDPPTTKHKDIAADREPPTVPPPAPKQAPPNSATNPKSTNPSPPSTDVAPRGSALLDSSDTPMDSNEPISLDNLPQSVLEDLIQEYITARMLDGTSERIPELENVMNVMRKSKDSTSSIRTLMHQLASRSKETNEEPQHSNTKRQSEIDSNNSSSPFIPVAPPPPVARTPTRGWGAPYITPATGHEAHSDSRTRWTLKPPPASTGANTSHQQTPYAVPSPPPTARHSREHQPSMYNSGDYVTDGAHQNRMTRIEPSPERISDLLKSMNEHGQGLSTKINDNHDQFLERLQEILLKRTQLCLWAPATFVHRHTFEAVPVDQRQRSQSS